MIYTIIFSIRFIKFNRMFLAMDRVRGFISYADGRCTKKPETQKKSSTTGGSKKTWSQPEINELFERSQKLSEAIHLTEQEAESLGSLTEVIDRFTAEANVIERQVINLLYTNF